MAQLTGKLGADFSAFNDAVQKADAYVTNLSAGADRAGVRLNAMQDSLSGKTIVQQATLAAEAVDRIGGIAKLTEAELQKVGAMAQQAADKLKALGQDVPPKIWAIADATRHTGDTLKAATESTDNWMTALGKTNQLLAAFGVGLSIGAVVAFVKETVSGAQALTKMHEQTDISVESLQRMRIAGDATGVSLESMTAAATMLQKRLGGGDASVNSALGDLGINIQKFQNLSADQQMAALSDAVRGMHDPLRVATDLSALFGKSWAEQLPVLKRGFQEVKDGVTVMSAESVKALDEWGNAAGRWWTEAQRVFGENLTSLLTLSLSTTRQLNSDIKNLATPPDAAAYTNFWKAVVPPGLPKDLDEITRKMDAQLEADIKTKQAMVELNSAGAGWKGTLDTINGSVAEAIKFYLDAGVSQKALAAAYGLTETQVKAVDSALKAETVSLQLEAKAIEDSKVRWAETAALKMQISGTTTQRVKADIDLWVQHEIESHVRAKTDTADFYSWLGQQSKLMAQAEDQQRILSDTNSRASFEKRKQAADDWLQFVMAHVSEFTNADIDQAVKRAAAATQEWAHFGQAAATALDATKAKIEAVTAAAEKARAAMMAMGNTLDLATAAQDPEIMNLLKQGYSLKNAEAIKLGRQQGFTPQLYDEKGNPETSPSKGEGVPGYAPSASSPAKPAGGNITMAPASQVAGAGGSGSSYNSQGIPVAQTINLVVDGRVLATVVSDQLTKELMQGRLLPTR